MIRGENWTFDWWMIMQIFWTTITQQQCSKYISLSINVIVVVVVTGEYYKESQLFIVV